MIKEKTIRFTVYAGTGHAGATSHDTLDIPESELSGVCKDRWTEYVWDKLGGREMAENMIDSGCYIGEPGS